LNQFGSQAHTFDVDRDAVANPLEKEKQFHPDLWQNNNPRVMSIKLGVTGHFRNDSFAQTIY